MHVGYRRRCRRAWAVRQAVEQKGGGCDSWGDLISRRERVGLGHWRFFEATCRVVRRCLVDLAEWLDGCAYYQQECVPLRTRQRHRETRWTNRHRRLLPFLRCRILRHSRSATMRADSTAYSCLRCQVAPEQTQCAGRAHASATH